jgi:putative phosphoribosyl transferase
MGETTSGTVEFKARTKVGLFGESMLFNDRVDAGRKLAKRLEAYAKRKDVIVLGIPRGGVPVAFEVAKALEAPLDVFLSRKLGVPGQEELAFGAVASGGVRVLDRQIIEAVGVSDQQIEQTTQAVKKELERREGLFRGSRPPLNGWILFFNNFTSKFAVGVLYV